jgi:hypothetical protein
MMGKSNRKGVKWLKNLLTTMLITMIILIAGCNSANSSKPNNSFDSSELDKYTVKTIDEEAVQGDFLFRLVSEKKEYHVGEEVKLYGEIEYIGELDEVTIHHASQAILFPMTEQIRNYKIHSMVEEIGLSTTLKKGEPYREEYAKSGGFAMDVDPPDYIEFMEDFLNRDGFPPGYYVVSGTTNFAYETERYEIQATVEFKVVD